MEKKLVQYITGLICAVSFCACVLVWFLPVIDTAVTEMWGQVLQNKEDRKARYAMLEKMSGLEIMDYNTQQVQERVQEGREDSKEIQFSQQIRLELPKGTSGEDVKVEADYVNREIRVRLPGADEHYLYDYSLIGKSDGINNLSFDSRDGQGTIVLSMSTVKEAESSYDERYLYLDFISPRDIFDYLVVVDAGHGGVQPGAVVGDVYEKNINLAIVQKVKQLFDADDSSSIGVYYTRLDDAGPSLEQRVDMANLMGADLFLSVHINSLAGHSAVEGTEVMYDELAADTAFDTKDFAQICQEEEVAALGSRDLGIVKGHNIYIIRTAQMPVALVEVGFINNPQERAQMLSEDYQQKAAQGVFRAIKRSIGELEKLKKK